MKSTLLSAIAVGTLIASSANAATIGNVDYTSDGTCSVSDLVINADACIGVLPGNDDNEFKDDTNANKANFNLDSFDGTLGLFGRTNWSFLAKANTSSSADGSTHSEAGITINFGATAADADTWSTTSDLSLFEYVAIVLKQSSGFSAYLYDGNAPSAGEWETSVAAFGNSAGGLSHLSIYTGPPIAPVPLPAGAALMLTGLGGFALARRRKKA